MRIEEMLDRYRPIERVSEISTAKRAKEPEIQKAMLGKFDYMLKQEEKECRNGKVRYVQNGNRHTFKEC